MSMIAHFRNLGDEVCDDGFGCDVVCGGTCYKPSELLPLEEYGKWCVIPRPEYDNCGITADMMRNVARRHDEKIFREVFWGGKQ